MQTLDTDKQLRVSNLGCIRQQRTLFANISFELSPGQALLIEGPNGSGKSSLLRLLTGLITPQDGEIRWQQNQIQDNLADYVSHLHYIGHTNGVKLGLSVIENLRLASHLAMASSTTDLDVILSQLQLHLHRDTLARFLSAGQKRRLALAKLFLFPKTLWLLDEPLTALDSNTQAYFITQLEAHLHRGGIVVMSSHHPIHLNGLTVKSLRLES